jgi:uncharacterized protein
MKTSAFVIFLLVVLTVYGLVNTYIFLRGLQALPPGTTIRSWYIPVFWFLAASFVLARFLERAIPCNVTEMFSWVGSFWLAAMAYFLLIILLLDITRGLNHLLHFLPSVIYDDYAKVKLIIFWTSLVIVSVTLFAGFINARNPRIKRLEIGIRKDAGGLDSLTIALASDIHLGTLVGKNGARRLVDGINNLNPDIILLAGDVVDEDVKPVIRRNLGETLSNLKSRYGVYAITGNHEYIGGAEEAVRYLQAHNIKYLRDTALLIDQKFWLAGREDRDISRFSGKSRKPLNEVLNGVDRARPVILMDHQPFNFGDVVKENVDLQLSGHTHHGQIWPFNWITNAIYEVSWGYKKKEETHFYVSSGFGTWGPPVRLGNRPEIVYIVVHFTH